MAPWHETFARFAAARKRKFRQISAATQGEATADDVENEAFILAAELTSKGTVLDLDNLQHQDLLIAHLYQRLVRYTEVHVRHAVRLDHSPDGEEDQAHPLMNRLAADEHFDPAMAIIRDEAALPMAPDPEPHESLAAAYVHLLRRFDNRMKDVADHLLISLSYCYRRCSHAKVLAVHQWPLPAPAKVTAFVPSAWRRFRLLREPLQLAFDFNAPGPLFPADGCSA